jgi:hypothetical protein
MSSGFLTAPILRKSRDYPFHDFPAYAKPIIVRAIEAAWERICEHSEQHGGALREEKEDALTTRLEECLNDIQSEPEHPSGFSASLFQAVVRDAAVTSYDDSSLKKRPDLTFRLVPVEPGLERSSHYGLFVECKIVGPRHPVQIYCDEGLRRFVSGEYAWAMPCGMMLGYAWKGFSIPDTLNHHLQTGTSTGLSLRSLPQPLPALAKSFPVFESAHSRTWLRDGKSHGDIAIYHLWLPLQTERG